MPRTSRAPSPAPRDAGVVDAGGLHFDLTPGAGLASPGDAGGYGSPSMTAAIPAAGLALAPHVDAEPSTAVAVLDERLAAIRDAYTEPPRWLRALTFESIELDVVLQATGGDLTPEIEERLDALLERLTESADAVGDYLAANDALLEMWKAERDRLDELMKRRKESLTKYRQRIANYLLQQGRPKLTGAFWTLRAQTNPPSLKVRDAQELPASYQVVTVTFDATTNPELVREAEERWARDHAAWRAAVDALPLGTPASEYPPEPRAPERVVVADNKRLKADLQQWEKAVDAIDASRAARAAAATNGTGGPINLSDVEDEGDADAAAALVLAPATPAYPPRPAPETVAWLERGVSLQVK